MYEALGGTDKLHDHCGVLVICRYFDITSSNAVSDKYIPKDKFHALLIQLYLLVYSFKYHGLLLSDAIKTFQF